MRQYKTVQVPKRVIESLRCNCCGRVIQSRECFSAVKHWGYDSPYDGEVHAMDICADCYAVWIQRKGNQRKDDGGRCWTFVF